MTYRCNYNNIVLRFNNNNYSNRLCINEVFSGADLEFFFYGWCYFFSNGSKVFIMIK